MNLPALSLALLSIGLSAMAQLLMKIGMTAIRAGGAGAGDMLIRAALNPFVIGGFAAYGVGAVLWLFVLSRIDLSMAYPLVSIGFILVAIFSHFWLGENISPGRIGGIALIIGGVLLISRS